MKERIFRRKEKKKVKERLLSTILFVPVKILSRRTKTTKTSFGRAPKRALAPAPREAKWGAPTRRGGADGGRQETADAGAEGGASGGRQEGSMAAEVEGDRDDGASG